MDLPMLIILRFNILFYLMKTRYVQPMQVFSELGLGLSVLSDSMPLPIRPTCWLLP